MSIVFDFADIASRMREDAWYQVPGACESKVIVAADLPAYSPSVINQFAREYMVSQANNRYQNGLGLGGKLGANSSNLYAANSLSSLYQGLSKSNV
jgi:hypothetical protein